MVKTISDATAVHRSGWDLQKKPETIASNAALPIEPDKGR
jgi:hypothetical protein